MNREIKFRAWDIELKKYHYPNMWDKSMPSNWENYYILEQFTGLKDKNGKEIFEGDVCRILYTDWPSNSNPNISIEDYLISISHLGIIEYHSPSFEIMLKDRYGDFSGHTLRYGSHGFVEVIGNIHENSELLNA